MTTNVTVGSVGINYYLRKAFVFMFIFIYSSFHNVFQLKSHISKFNTTTANISRTKCHIRKQITPLINRGIEE